MATKCRKAVDRAVKDLNKAYEALNALAAVLPEKARNDRHQRWIHELAEYADYLAGVTWPDEKEI